MKKTFILACILTVGFLQAQSLEPTYKVAGDLVKVTYFYKDGTIHKTGFFKNKLLEGQWLEFDQKGNKIAIANYKNGQKVGKWFLWHKDILREVNYEKNTIASVKSWKEDSQLAIRQP